MWKFLVLVTCISICFGHKFQSYFEELDLDNISEQLDGSISMQVSPSVLDQPGWVTLQWSGVQNPNKTDWIGVYSPSTVSVKKTAPIKYQMAIVSPNYLNTGAGSLNFRMLNLREDYIFALLKGVDHPVAVAYSNVLSFTNYEVPMHAHLMLTGNPNELKLLWVSKETSNPSVRIGTASNNYDRSISANTTTFTRDQMCGSPANSKGWRDPGYIHYAVIDELVPQQRYYYVYGDPQSGGWSEEETFLAPPSVGADQVIDVISYGDMGQFNLDGSLEHWGESPSLNTTKNVIRKLGEIDLVLHIGDISYAVGYEAQWDQFFEQIQPIATSVPYMTCVGNHERDFPNSDSYYNGTDSGGECGVPYNTYLPMPTPGFDKPWYSFNFGNIHYLLLSTEHNFLEGSEQYNYVVNDLQNVDRTQTPWLIVGGHRPMYIDSTSNFEPSGDQPVAKLLRSNLEKLLLKYKVDLALWGHHHSYQRSCPLYDSQCVQEGPVHVVIGMAGMGLTKNLEPTPPSWMVTLDDDDYGYSQMRTNATTLEFWYYSNSAGLKDYFFLSK